jgi:glycosyltransferase involved in cell wall biosynthesis
MQKMISIVIPAHNEEKRIGNTLESYSRYFNLLAKSNKLDYELLVVINNTKDRTEEIVKEKQNKDKHIRYLNFKEGGKGFAVIEGFKDALKRKSNLIGFVDADGATPPQAFHYLIQNINNDDGAMASRYLPASIVNPKPTIQRVIVSRIFNNLIRVLFLMPYKDTQCGAKLFKRKALEKVLPHLSLSQWAFDVDLIYNLRKFGFRVAELPTIWSDKKYSKINFMRAGPFMALSLIRLRLINSPFAFVMHLYDRLPNSIKFHNRFR